jgi:hypothetical protein
MRSWRVRSRAARSAAGRQRSSPQPLRSSAAAGPGRGGDAEIESHLDLGSAVWENTDQDPLAQSGHQLESHAEAGAWNVGCAALALVGDPDAEGAPLHAVEMVNASPRVPVEAYAWRIAFVEASLTADSISASAPWEAPASRAIRTTCLRAAPIAAAVAGYVMHGVGARATGRRYHAAFR